MLYTSPCCDPSDTFLMKVHPVDQAVPQPLPQQKKSRELLTPTQHTDSSKWLEEEGETGQQV